MYNQFVNGVGSHCNPGYQLDTYPQPDNVIVTAIAAIAIGLALGNPVLVPDYLGPYGAFPLNRVGSHIILDSMRAMQHVPYNLKKSPFVIMGIFGGGLVTQYVAVEQPYYAPDLTSRIKHILVMDSASNMIDVAAYGGFYGPLQYIPHPANGFMMSFMIAAAREYPDKLGNLDKWFSGAGRIQAALTKDGCQLQSIAENAVVPHALVMKSGFEQSPEFEALLWAAKDSIVWYHPGHPSVPVTLMHGIADPVLPQARLERQLAERWTEQGSENITSRLYPAGHVTTPAMAAPRTFYIMLSELLKR